MLFREKIIAVRAFLQKIIDLVRQYDCEKHAYFMCGHDGVLEALQEMAAATSKV